MATKTFTRGQTTATTFGRTTPKGEFARRQVERDIARIEAGEAFAGIGIAQITTPEGEIVKGVVTQKFELERIEDTTRDVPRLSQMVTTPRGAFIPEQPIVSEQLNVDFARQQRQARDARLQQPGQLSGLVTGSAIKDQTGFKGFVTREKEFNRPFIEGAKTIGSNIFGFASQREAQETLGMIRTSQEKAQQEFNLARAGGEKLSKSEVFFKGVGTIGGGALLSIPTALVAQPKETLKGFGTALIYPVKTIQAQARLAGESPETAFFGTLVPALFFAGGKIGATARKATTVKFGEPVTTQAQTLITKRAFVAGAVKKRPDIIEVSKTKLQFEQPRTLKIAGVKKEIQLKPIRGEAELNLLVEGRNVLTGGKVSQRVGVTVTGGKVSRIIPGVKIGLTKGRPTIAKVSIPKDTFKIKAGAGELRPTLTRGKAFLPEFGAKRQPGFKAFFKQPQITPTAGKIKIIFKGKPGEALAAVSPRRQIIIPRGELPPSKAYPFGQRFFITRGKGQAIALTGGKLPRATLRQFTTKEQIIDIAPKKPGDIPTVDFIIKSSKIPSELRPRIFRQPKQPKVEPTFRQPLPPIGKKAQVSLEVLTRQVPVTGQIPKPAFLFQIGQKTGRTGAVFPIIRQPTIGETRIIQRETTVPVQREVPGQIPRQDVGLVTGTAFTPFTGQVTKQAQIPVQITPPAEKFPTPIPTQTPTRTVQRLITPVIPSLRIPGFPDLRVPVFGLPFPQLAGFNRLGFRQPRKQQRGFQPNLFGLISGKTQAKAPKFKLTGLEIRLPISLKRKKRR